MPNFGNGYSGGSGGGGGDADTLQGHAASYFDATTATKTAAQISDASASGRNWLKGNAGVMLWQKASGTYKQYTLSADTDAACGTAIASALSDSVSGDIIEVYRNATVTAHVTKNGVNLTGPPGVTITASGTNVSILDDSSTGANGACTVKIFGGLTLSHADNGQDGNVIKIFNASSDFHIQCDTLQSLENTANSLARNVILQKGGRLIVQAQKMTSLKTAGYYWEDGDAKLFIQEASCADPNTPTFYAIANTDTPTGEVWIFCQHNRAKVPIQTGCTATSDGQGRFWYVGQTIYVPASGVNTAITLGTGLFSYVTLQKLNFEGAINSINHIEIGGYAKMNIEKVTTRSGTGAVFMNINADLSSAGDRKALIHFDQVDTSNGLPANGFISADSVDVNYTGEDLTLPANRDAFTFTDVSNPASWHMDVRDVAVVVSGTGKAFVQGGTGVVRYTPSVHFDHSKVTGTIKQIGSLVGPPQALTISASHVAVDAMIGTNFTLSASASFTLDKATGGYDGQEINILITQSSGGSHTITLGTGIVLPAGQTVTLTTTDAHSDLLVLRYNAAADKYLVTAFIPDYTL